jgi:hypothetical protein
MACTPLNIATGLFFNTTPISWSTAPTTNQGGKTVTLDLTGISVTGPTGTMPFHATPSGRRSKYMFIGTDNYLLLLDSDTGAGLITHYVSLVDFTTTPPTERSLFFVLTSSSAVNPPNVHFSPGNGAVFLIYSPTGTTPALDPVSNIAIHRSDNGAILCSALPFTPTLQLTAEATATELHIKHGSTNIANCPKPMGSLSISPSSQTFPDVRVGGCSTTPPTKQFVLRNSGNDCLTISNIANSGPFTVVATSKPLPATLASGETMTADVRFAPTTIGAVGPTNLTVTRLPAVGNDHFVCQGQGVAPIVQISFSSSNINFGVVAAGTTAGPQNLHIRNTGGTPLNCSIPGSPLGSPFQWTGFAGPIDCGAEHVIAINFSPTTEGTFTAAVNVTSGAPGSPHSIALTGQGCVPNAVIVVPPAPFPSFGDVQQGFRTVRFITIQNTGDGPLTFTARIDGTDAVLFGLQPPSGSITDVLASRTYTVNPVTPCGSLASGDGQTRVAVAFFANSTPRNAAANLLIEGHNATNTTTLNWSFLLNANIVAPIAVDTALVLDRSGSMTDMLGTRNKSEAEIAGAGLFAQLIRPDLDDRLAIVKFDDVPDVVLPMTLVTSANHNALVGLINSTELAPRNTTSIAAGVMTALPLFNVPRTVTPPQLTKAIVVLTDGMDNTAYQNPADGRWYSVLGGMSNSPAGSGLVSTDPFAVPTNIKIYGIGLGRAADIDTAALNRLSTATGAYHGVVGDLVGATYFSLEKYFVQIFMDIVGTSSVSEPLYTIKPGQQQLIEYDVLRGDVRALIVMFDYHGERLPFYLRSPKGEIIDASFVPPGYQVRVGSTKSSRFIEYTMPLNEPDRYAGRWAVVVEHHGEVCMGRPQPDRDRTRGFLPRECRQTKEPVNYGVAIGVGSNFRMQPYITPGDVYVGDPILLSAQVSEAGLPVTNCNVTVRAESPGGNVWNLTLLDDGLHEDGDPNDGEYARRFTYTGEEGSYEFTFRAVGMSRDGEPVVREAVRSKYVIGYQTGDPGGGKRPGEVDGCCTEMIRLLEEQNKLLKEFLNRNSPPDSF